MKKSLLVTAISLVVLTTCTACAQPIDTNADNADRDNIGEIRIETEYIKEKNVSYVDDIFEIKVNQADYINYAESNLKLLNNKEAIFGSYGLYQVPKYSLIYQRDKLVGLSGTDVEYAKAVLNVAQSNTNYVSCSFDSMELLEEAIALDKMGTASIMFYEDDIAESLSKLGNELTIFDCYYGCPLYIYNGFEYDWAFPVNVVNESGKTMLIGFVYGAEYKDTIEENQIFNMTNKPFEGNELEQKMFNASYNQEDGKIYLEQLGNDIVDYEIITDISYPMPLYVYGR